MESRAGIGPLGKMFEGLVKRGHFTDILLGFTIGRNPPVSSNGIFPGIVGR